MNQIKVITQSKETLKWINKQITFHHQKKKKKIQN